MKFPEEFVIKGFALKKITTDFAEVDYKVVMDNLDYLRDKPTPPECGLWPTEDLTLEQNRKDLAHHEKEFNNGLSFAYAVLDPSNNDYWGCLFFYPQGERCEIYFWLIEDYNSKEVVLQKEIKNWVEDTNLFIKIDFPKR